jgi:hypothetical protein
MDGRIGWPLIDCKHQAGVKRRRGRHARKLVPFRPPAGSTVCCAGCGRRVLIKLARAPPSFQASARAGHILRGISPRVSGRSRPRGRPDQRSTRGPEQVRRPTPKARPAGSRLKRFASVTGYPARTGRLRLEEEPCDTAFTIFAAS